MDSARIQAYDSFSSCDTGDYRNKS